jgi:RHS repeat-associated protein
MGKERDEESGLYYHGARYYAPWLARWVSCDPAGMVDGSNLYIFAKNDPRRYTDTTGTQADDTGRDFPANAFQPLVITGDRITGANPHDTNSSQQQTEAVTSQERPKNLGEFVDLPWDTKLHMLRKEKIPVQRIHGVSYSWDELQKLEDKNIEEMTWEAFSGVTNSLMAVGRAWPSLPNASRSFKVVDPASAPKAWSSSLPKPLRDWWYKGSEGDAAWQQLPNFPDKIYHEIGQNTVQKQKIVELSNFSPVERGKKILQSGNIRDIFGLHPIELSQNMGSGPTALDRALGELLTGSAKVAVSQSVQRSGVAAYLSLVYSANSNMCSQRTGAVDEGGQP